MKKIGVLLAFLLCLTSVFAQQSIEQLESLAKKNDVSAMLELAHQYETKGNSELAIKWYEKAAKNDNVDAMMQLGYIYKKNKDTKNASKWFEKATKKGNILAKYNLGLILLSSNREKGFNYILEAAKDGNSDAQYQIGSYYKNGFQKNSVEYLVRKDNSTAQEWFLKSAENDNENAIKEIINDGTDDNKLSLLKISTIKGNNQVVSKILLNSKIKLQTLYTDWAIQQANEDNLEGVNNVIKFCKDQKLKNDAYQCLAEKGNIEAAYQLGLYYYDKNEYNLALKYLEQAANGNNADALYLLSLMYWKEYGVEKNLELTFQYAKKSAELGKDNAMLLIGSMLESGIGVEKNIDEAINWYKKASLNGNQTAQTEYKRLVEGETKYISGANKYLVKKKGMVGLMDNNKSEYIVPLGTYSKISDKFIGEKTFVESGTIIYMLEVSNENDSLVGAINLKGELVVPIRYESISGKGNESNWGGNNGQSVAFAKDKDGRIDVYNENGLLIASSDKYSKFSKIVNSNLIAFQDDKIGAIDIKTGDINVPFGKYTGIGHSVNTFGNTYIYYGVLKNKKIGAINAKTKKEVAAPIYDKFLGIDPSNGNLLFENNTNSTNETFFIISPEGKVLASKAFSKGYGTFSRGLEFANWCKQYDLTVGSLLNY